MRQKDPQYPSIIATRGQKKRIAQEATAAKAPMGAVGVQFDVAEETGTPQDRRPTKRNLAYQFPTPNAQVILATADINVENDVAENESGEYDALEEVSPAAATFVESTATFSSPFRPFNPQDDSSFREYLGTPAQQAMGRRFETPGKYLTDSPSAFWSPVSPVQIPTANVLLETIATLRDYLQGMLDLDCYDALKLSKQAELATAAIQEELKTVHEAHITLRELYGEFLTKVNAFAMMIKPFAQNNQRVERELIEHFLADIAPRQAVEVKL